MIQRGPVAPKDPTEKQKGFYILLDTIVEALERKGQSPAQDIYLDCGRLMNNAKIVGDIKDQEILDLLDKTNDFRKLVKKIGVTVSSNETEKVNFVFHSYGKVDRYNGGTRIEMTCPCNGAEYMLDLEDYEWSEDDDVVGMMAFEFPEVGMTGKVSVKLYVADGYDIPEISVDPPVAFESTAYKEMIAKSLMDEGNNYRLKKFLEKAQKGEEVTVAYIGGSITQGAGAKPIHSECYAARSYEALKEKFTPNHGANMHYIKAGVGGTPSELGMIRYERDVLRDGAAQPDLVVIEFAVNDEGDETKGACFESLVLKCLTSPNKPAVVLLFSVFSDDFNLQERLSPIGMHYNVPMVSVKDAVTPQFDLVRTEGGVISKRQYFYDIFHPTNDGHQVMADCLIYLFEQVAAAGWDEEITAYPTEPVKGNSFTNVHCIDRHYTLEGTEIVEGGFTATDEVLQYVEMNEDTCGTPQFPFNWQHTPESGSESFKISIESKNLLLVFKDSGDPNFGKACIYVDGKLAREAEPYLNGWNHCNAIILYDEKDCKRHEVEIKMAEGHEDKYFTILGFGYTQD
ncbi:SGNH/GDSL hydrolase family protein [Cellulosilyticum ruminicola]|uniref:SGNH/GDSL hydrolase family protein n=1 Tax=Cellulosilyticum ruminicola TaxID=425254 RepID=UPI0006D26FA4|nr:SGNH/GDSL hydrolase family protein [Cellulosilyticum ruminicola]